MNQVAKQTDAIVSNFTRDLLGLARKNKVEFAYAGSKGNAPAEINRVMRINTGVVKDLLGRKERLLK